MIKYNKYIVLLTIGGAALLGCASSRTIAIDISGESGRVEYSTYLRTGGNSDKSTFDIEKKRQEFLNPPLTGEVSELKQLDGNRKIKDLPLSETYSVSRDGKLYLFIKPHAAQGDIVVSITIDGKKRKKYSLKPNSLGVYLSY